MCGTPQRPPRSSPTNCQELVLCSLQAAGRTGKKGFRRAGRQVVSKGFTGLLAQAHARGKGRQQRLPNMAASDESISQEEFKRRAAAVHKQAQLGQLRRARQALTASALEPKTEKTSAQLTDPARRPPTPTTPLPGAVSSFPSQSPMQLDKALVAPSARSHGRGLAKDAPDTANKKLDDPMTTDLWRNPAAPLARCEMLEPVARGIAVGRMMALPR